MVITIEAISDERAEYTYSSFQTSNSTGCFENINPFKCKGFYRFLSNFSYFSEDAVRKFTSICKEKPTVVLAITIRIQIF